MDRLKPSTTTNHLVKELYEDLGRKYRLHRATIETAWRSFDKARRTKCMKAGSQFGLVLKHSGDRSIDEVYKMLPEWNLRDIADPVSDHLLDLLKHRATATLFEQYRGDPATETQGDYGVIRHSMDFKGLRHSERFVDCYTLFTNDENYGTSYKLVSEKEETLAAFAPAIKARICLRQSTGELILQRQMYLLQCCNIMIDDILLEAGSKTRPKKKIPKKSDKAATAALSKLSIQTSRPKLTLPDLAASARDQADALDEYLELLVSEPVVLCYAVNMHFFTRPELTPDEKGRRLPAHTDRFVSASFFETVHNAVKGAALWKYIVRLVELLDAAGDDKAYRGIILQELSNLCQLEYGRAQAAFKRSVQVRTGSKWFKRLAGRFDAYGNARIAMKGNPEELLRSDAQLHYVLRLCQADTTSTKAIDWVTKLANLHETHPSERERLEESDIDSLADLVIIIGFIQDLSSVSSLPAASRKKGQAFLSRWQELDAELSPLKAEIDVQDFGAPIENLVEPGMADSALKTVDQFVVEKAGTKLGFLYQDLLEECISKIQAQYEQSKTKLNETEYTPPVSAPEQPDERLQQRRQKEKTRPSVSSNYEIAPSQEESRAAEKQAAPPAETFKVSASTAEVFSTLFAKSEARGSVSWAAFEGAMADLGFSVFPKFGSVFTFYPPESMSIRRPLTLHRPHGSHIEGYQLLIYARRLKRAYGWNDGMFRVL